MAASYSAASVTVKEGDATADFKIQRTGTGSEMQQQGTVSYQTADASAKAGTDYTATSGTLNFDAGVTEMTVSVAIQSSAYDSKADLTFLLNMGAYGAATGTIKASPNPTDKQAYLYIPEADTETTIPTADSPGTNLPQQAVYEDFSDPPENETQVDRPLAYMRLGYARSDLNYYERVILDTDTYHPVWQNSDPSNPTEPGTMYKFMLPRAVNREEEEDVDEAKAENKHLDGVLIYSDKNYNVTVGAQASTVVQGDYILSVQGTGRLNWRDKKSEWIYDGGEGAFRIASGVTKINGQPAEYKISSARSLTVQAEQEVCYSFGAKYEVATDAAMEVKNAAQYEIVNSIKLEVKGLQVAGECDIFGNFEVTYPTGEIMSTRGEYEVAASHEINLSIQAGTSKAWTVAVAAAAATNAAAGLAISTGVAASTFKKDSDFYKMATPFGLDNSYNDAVADGLPDTCAALSAVTAGILVAAAVAQAIAAELPTPMPKVEMTAAGMTLSCGPQSSIEITAEGINFTAPEVNFLSFGEFGVLAGEAVELMSAVSVGLEATDISLTGLTTAGDIICGNIVAGDILATDVITA